MLGPGGDGLNLLRDRDGDGSLTPADVGVSAVDDEIVFELSFGGDLQASTPLDLAFGGSGLGLEVEGDASIGADFSFDLGLGFDLSTGPFFEFGSGNDISVGLRADVDLDGEAKLGPLVVSLETIPAEELPVAARRRARLDPDDESTEAVNAVLARFGLNLDPGRYSLSTLPSALRGAAVNAEVVGSLYARVDTGLNTSLEGLPSVVADLNLNFDRSTGSLESAIATLTSPQLTLTNAGLNLGTFVSEVIGPVLNPINDFLDPIRPVLEQLTSPIPVLSDLIGPTTYVDLISLFGEGGDTVAAFVNAAADLIRLIDVPEIPSLGDGPNRLLLPLGDFATELVDGKFQRSGDGGSSTFDSFVSELGGEFGEFKDYLQSIPREATASSGSSLETTPGKFSIPLFDNPASAIDLLFGNPVDLIKYQAPQLNVGFDFQIGIPVFPVFNITVGGQLNAIIDFAFGYDTAGILKYGETRRPLDLLDGFFFDDRAVFDSSGNKTSDIAELTFRFAVTAGGELDLKAAKAGVEAGLGAALLLDLNDPNLDGKIRFDEVLQNLQLGNAPALGPLWIFDASGQLDAFLTAYAKAFGIRVQATLGPKVLVNYDFPRPEPANPVLGHVTDDGTLIVHVGDSAPLREEGNTEDGDETVFISTDHDTGRTVITGFGTDQSFPGVQRVRIESGAGNDVIFIEDDFALPVYVDASIGDDDITGGAGPLTAYGGTGRDTVVGGSGHDTLHGGPSQPVFQTDPITFELFEVFDLGDLLDGGEGDDRIFGGDGDDQIQGGAGNDIIEGQSGDDYLGGGEGHDLIRGGDGDDVLSGDNGDDTLSGELGFDFLQGGGGADSLDGGDQDDELFGGMGGDVLIGGAGNDLLVGAVTTRDNPDFEALQAALDFDAHVFDGGDGNDLIYGTAGVDEVTDLLGSSRVFTYESDDIITTGDGSDLVRSGDGADVIDVGGGINEVYAGAGYDIVSSGPGNDTIDLRPEVPGTGQSFGAIVNDAGGSNRILGDAGDDRVTVIGFSINFIDVGDGDNVVFTGGGSDVIRAGNGRDLIQAGDGNNDITAGGGDDSVTAGFGDDHVRLGSGNDIANVGAGNDVVIAGLGNDLVDAGSGDDYVRGGGGDDELIAGVGADTLLGDAGSDILWGGLREYTAGQLRANPVVPDAYSADTSALPFPAIVPAIVSAQSLPGSFEDGNDVLRGGEGPDLVFGGGGSDEITGGPGDNYLDGGRGVDVIVGGDNFDVIRGGDGDDDLRGGAGLDFVYGDDGDDFLRGDAGVGSGVAQILYGQKLFGGRGNDILWAYAPTPDLAEQDRLGDLLDGGDGADELLGNIRREMLVGGFGDDLLSGDGLRGDAYGANDLPELIGGSDTLLGDFGDDVLLGHGGDDQLWGGGNSDDLEGHDGADSLFGGGGIDFLRFDVDERYAVGGDVIDGHFDDRPDANRADDDATDILIIPGTLGDDRIELAGGAAGQMLVHYNGRNLAAEIRSDQGTTRVEQFQINGLAGDDEIGFDASLDLADLAQRSRDWIGVINGGSGNDTLTGSVGRDRLDGGRGSDTVFGLSGDDRLWGDAGDGSVLDEDALFAGSGNDDLLGGVGDNRLYAWSSDPGEVGPDFGIFVDPLSGQRSAVALPGFVLEETGLNRMLGRDGDDSLFAGTGLDFMYGGAGRDLLHDVNGVPFESSIGVPEDEEWLEYARSTDKVWYYGGSGSDDVITVDFVTEPGLLGGHHLITRLTENAGRFTFDAQVQLDFAATNPDGTLVWDPQDLVYRLEEIGGITDDDQRRLAEQSLVLSGDLIPPEGDYLAIIIAAKEGDDQVFVGPTVQRTVWVAAGDGDDRVEFSGGAAILADLADSDSRNEVAGSPDDSSAAHLLEPIEVTKLFANLTLDNPSDVDWFAFDLTGELSPEAELIVDSLGEEDEIELQLWREVEPGVVKLIEAATSTASTATIDIQKTSRARIDLASLDRGDGIRYFVRVRSLAQIPTVYDLGFDLGDGKPLALNPIELGVRSDTFARRDVIVGGPGADVLLGGPSEDWVIGGSGNDVISGGIDGLASDILIGEDGDDVFQIIPSAIEKMDLTLADEIDGGEGYDRTLFLGGDLDSFGWAVPDHVSLRYHPLLASYELTALVWDTANQRFLADGKDYAKHSSAFRARRVEAMDFELRSGNDELHLEETYYFPKVDGTDDRTEAYGIAAGDRQAGGTAIRFDVSGGDGDDRIFGSAYADTIDAGAGFDLVVGGLGNDRIDAGSENDLVLGGEMDASSVLFDAHETTIVGGVSRRNDSLSAASLISLQASSTPGFTLHDGDFGDWYLLPLPENEGTLPDLDGTFSITPEFESFRSLNLQFSLSEPIVQSYYAAWDATTEQYIPVASESAERVLLHVRNPLTSAIVADQAPQVNTLTGAALQASMIVRFDNGRQRNLLFNLEPGAGGQQVADAIQASIESNNLEDRLLALYIDEFDRLALVAIDGSDLSITTGTPANLHYAGFSSEQTNDRAPSALGGYQINSTLKFPLNEPAGPDLQPRPYEYRLATPQLQVSVPPAVAELSDPDLQISTARRWEGDSAAEELSEVVPIGDVNADGRDDVILLSNDYAYVFLADLDPRFDIASARDEADFVIDVRAGHRPFAGDIDLDGDGKGEVGFWQFNDVDQDGIGTIVLSLLHGRDLIDQPLRNSGDRSQQREFSAAARLQTITTIGFEGDFRGIDLEWMRFNDDDWLDLMVLSRTPILAGPGGSLDPGYGYVLDGSKIASSPGSQLSTSAQLAFINDQSESAAVVTAPFDPSTLDEATPESSEVHFAAGDLDGDGQDEIVGVKPRGWTYEAERLSEIVTISRTYLIDTEGLVDRNIDLGGAVAPARLQHHDVTDIADGQLLGALSSSDPILIADLNVDGQDDVVLARERENGDLFSDALLIYSSGDFDGSIPIAADNSDDASLRVRGLGPGIFDTALTAGDFDGDGKVDLAIGRSRERFGDSSVTVLFEILAGAPVREVTDAFGDARPDALRLETTGSDGGFGRLANASIDVTGDRIDDLLIGSPGAETTNGVLDGGSVVLVPGGQRRLPLPDLSQLTEISNDSIRGLGDIVDGNRGLIETEQSLAALQEIDWIRFQTTGDGEAGQFLSIDSGGGFPTELSIAGRGGELTTSGGLSDDVPRPEATSEKTAIIEFDLSGILAAYEDSDQITGAAITLSGAGQSAPLDLTRPTDPQQLTPTEAGGGFGERVFFEATSPEHGFELWVTDGTDVGTRLVFDAVAGPEGSFPFNLTAIGHRVMFTTESFGEDEESSLQSLYLSDGLITVEVEHPDGHDWNIQNRTFVAHDGSVYFSHDFQLYRAAVAADGSVSVTQLTNLSDNHGDLDLAGAMSTAAGLFFTRRVADGFQLWISDGSRDGTIALEAFGRGDRSTLTADSLSLAFAGGLLFAADRDDGRGSELWFSDGTRGGTRFVAETNPGSEDGVIYGFRNVSGRAYFFANHEELWRTDATGAGTERVRDLATSSQQLGLEANRAFVSSGMHVTVSPVETNRIALLSTQRDGTEGRRFDITAGQRATLQGATTVGDQVLVTYETLERFFTDSVDRVGIWDPITGEFTELTNFTDAPVSFRSPVELAGQGLFTGLIDSSTFRDQLYITDLTTAGTEPLVQPGIAGGEDVVVDVEVYPASNPQGISASDLDANPILTTQVTLGSRDTSFTLDLSDVRTLAALRQAVDHGYRSLAVSLNVTSGTAVVQTPEGTGTGLRLQRRGGVQAMLLDHVGRVIAEEFNHHDLRHLAAGVYYVGVSRSDGQRSDERSYHLVLDAPVLGHAGFTNDDDLIWGGDGSDVLGGGAGHDRLFGQSGVDTFVGEFFELRDRERLEVLRDGARDTIYADSVAPLLLADPEVVIAADAADGSINIVDPQLASALGKALDVPLVQNADGGHFARPVYASDLAAITSLNASGLGLTSLDGLQYLVGLQTLDLSANGTIGAGGLARLRPANGNREGTARLRHLNLDDNRISDTTNLGGLFNLRVLSIADQQHPTPLTNLAGLANLNRLLYVDASDNAIDDVSALATLPTLRAADLSGNPLEDLAPVSGSLVLDSKFGNVIPAASWLLSPHDAAVGGQAFSSRVATPDTAEVAWPTLKLAPGTYQVFANWHGDPSHDPQVTYQIEAAGAVEQVIVDQREPADLSAEPSARFGGIPFRQLATVIIKSDAPLLSVGLRGSGVGIATADAILVRAVDVQTGVLRRIDARGTRLDTHSRTIIADDLAERGVQLDTDENQLPVWTNVPNHLAIEVGAGYELGDLNALATDPEGSALTFAVTADHADLQLSRNGSAYKLSTDTAVDRPIQVMLSATDEAGLTASRLMTVVSGASFVTGNVVGVDRPIEGAVVFADLDDNGKFDAGESSTNTDRNGDYRLWVGNRADSVIRVATSDSLFRLPTSEMRVETHDHSLHEGVDLSVQQLRLELPNVVAEGSLTVAAYAGLTNADNVRWSVSGGPVTSQTVGDQFEFTPLDEGVYNVSVEVEVESQTLIASRSIVVTSVAAVANAGADTTIPEGVFSQTRSVVVDPGADVWEITIDYGDGSRPLRLAQTSTREVTFDHLYATPGVYEVGITVTDEFGKTFDSFALTVLDQSPSLALGIDESFREGVPGGLEINVSDPSGQFSPFSYQTLIDWGDGTIDDVSDDMDVFLGGGSASETFQHVFAEQGSVDVIVTLIDDEGVSLSETITIEVLNDLPQVNLQFPALVNEGAETDFRVEATDADGIRSVRWDFGDGAAGRNGTTVSHAFGNAGSYVVAVTVVDLEGGSTTRSRLVTVAEVNQPPRIAPVEAIDLTEAQPWSYALSVSDPDATDTIVWSLEGAPQGLTMGSDGVLSWTPSPTQGPASYQFDVIATDSAGAAARRSVSVEVSDTGAIRGQAFEDQDFDGTRDDLEPLVSGLTITLDRGDDGEIDQTAALNAEGSFDFEHLPLGLYRIAIALPAGAVSSTPTEFLVDFSTAQEIVLPSFGFSTDVDGDGVSNDAERSAAPGGDGNGDGIADWQQSYVVSLETPGGGVTVVSTPGTTFAEVATVATPSEAPPEYRYPIGGLSFELGGLPRGGRAELELILHGHPQLSAVIQYDESRPIDEAFSLLGESADVEVSVQSDRVTISEFDGGSSDLDAIADGRVKNTLLPATLVDAIWTNPGKPSDVNGDGRTSALDALLIVNALRRLGSPRVDLSTLDAEGEDYLDVNRDGVATALDALFVINQMLQDRRDSTTSGESDSTGG